MKQTIALQTPGRSELDQSSLFSYDQLTAARPTAPVIHRDARFLLVRSGSGILRLQGLSSGPRDAGGYPALADQRDHPGGRARHLQPHGLSL